MTSRIEIEGVVQVPRERFMRLALLPVGCWLLYQGTTGPWIALFFMTLVGCTDFVDGWLARKPELMLAQAAE